MKDVLIWRASEVSGASLGKCSSSSLAPLTMIFLSRLMNHDRCHVVIYDLPFVWVTHIHRRDHHHQLQH